MSRLQSALSGPNLIDEWQLNLHNYVMYIYKKNNCCELVSQKLENGSTDLIIHFVCPLQYWGGLEN